MKYIKHIAPIFLALILPCICAAQDSAATRPLYHPIHHYTPLPLVPQFPGGRDSLAAFIKKHTKYPSSARKHHITGVIEVDFHLDKEGVISNPKVLKPLGYGCDKEALRVVKLMPKWKPGMLGRDPMEIDYHVNIPFGTEAPVENHQ